MREFIHVDEYSCVFKYMCLTLFIKNIFFSWEALSKNDTSSSLKYENKIFLSTKLGLFFSL
jgi:hypothetical protein